ncbi:MAG: hypothetical protein IJL78_02450 [Lachnospiraceae bacterium]|nr:hypothetical protein [Lachnospiraceae bacterium]
MKFRDYELVFQNGGVTIEKDGKVLYFNHRPVHVTVKNEAAMLVFSDCAYASVSEGDEETEARGKYVTDNGSVLSFLDRYSVEGELIRISRAVTVEKADPRDLGFSTKIFFYQLQSQELTDYEYFSPGQWYLNNEYAGPYSLGKRMDLQYYYRKETYSGLPMFAMRHKATGETIAMSRWASDATLPSLDRTATENYAYVDPKITVGSFGVSNARPEAMTYTYYGHAFQTPLPYVECDGVSLDYVYPGVNGQMPVQGRGPFNVEQPLTNITWVHPMRKGFQQHYAVAVSCSSYEDFGSMMKATWRETYRRLKDRLFQVDNEELFHNMMRFLKAVTKRFGDDWGTPFVAQLPDFDPNSFSAEIGFVGQQAGIGYQLLRWGTMENDPEAIEKGIGILNTWVSHVTEDGCPVNWYHLSVHETEPQPLWVRQLGDGLEAVLDAYVFEKKHGREHMEWLNYCVLAADWLLPLQEKDGSFRRAYYYNGKMCLDSKASTPCIVRFFLQLYLVTGWKELREAAVRAGEWAYKHQYLGFEYRGGTCDQTDVMDKESGIYAMFAFTALYDVTKEEKWLKAACGAADYVETFTFVWSFPVDMPYPCHPFARYHISGTSNVTVGFGGGDVYMAACSYAYYRLWLLSGDEQYRDFAEFIHKNVKQANDIDGSSGYKYIGLVNEGGSISEQQYRGRYHWLPWCTFVEVDPASRMYDTFGVYEVADAEKLPSEERKARNEIYKNYWPAE